MLDEIVKKETALTLRSPNLAGGDRYAVEVRALKSVLEVVGMRTANDFLVVGVCASEVETVSSALAEVGEEALTVLDAKGEVAETVSRSLELDVAFKTL